VRSVASRYAWAMPIEDLCQAVWLRLASRPVGEHGSMAIEAYIASQATCACIDEVRSITRRGNAPVVMVEHTDQGEHDPWAGTDGTVDLVYLLASLPESERTETIRMACAESEREYAESHGHSKTWGNTQWLKNVKKLRRLAREAT
jgi:DNA-directed RNA polymerase specialized sigma24 family protein